jgi:hypothetical protein
VASVQAYGVLGTFWRLVLELCESLCDVAGHSHVDGARFVIPIHNETEVTGAGPFGGDGVEWLAGFNVILGVFAARVQTEDNGPGSMGEKTERVLCGYATEFREMLHESIVGELAGFGKTVHAFADFDVNVSVVDEVLVLVLLHEAGRNDFDGVHTYSYWSMGVLK